MDQRPKKLGLALGSGASRGLAHVGVINALEDAGISVDYIAGSSIGALVGATYAAGSINKFHDFLTTVDWKVVASYFDFNFPQKGLLEGRKLLGLIESLMVESDFENLNIPFCAIATNLSTGEEVHLKDGNLIHAVRASMSLPGIFNPFEIGDNYLVDGGLVNPVPVDVVREMGADIVIAVDLNHDLIKRNGRKKKLKTRRRKRRISVDKDSRLLTTASNANWFPTKLEQKYRTLEKSVKQSVNRWLEDRENDEMREPNIFDVIANSINIMEFKITQSKLLEDQPDILIQPKLGHLNLFDYDEAEATIEEGYQKTTSKLKDLTQLLHHNGQASGTD